jgi:hypothetical protein
VGATTNLDIYTYRALRETGVTSQTAFNLKKMRGQINFYNVGLAGSSACDVMVCVLSVNVNPVVCISLLEGRDVSKLS